MFTKDELSLISLLLAGIVNDKNISLEFRQDARGLHRKLFDVCTLEDAGEPINTEDIDLKPGAINYVAPPLTNNFIDDILSLIPEGSSEPCYSEIEKEKRQRDAYIRRILVAQRKYNNAISKNIRPLKNGVF